MQADPIVRLARFSRPAKSLEQWIESPVIGGDIAEATSADRMPP